MQMIGFILFRASCGCLVCEWQGEPEVMTEQKAEAVDPRVELAQDRTGMAKFRTQLALDRTALAWIRTTLTMATFGFGTIGFFRSVEEKTGNARGAQLFQGAIRFGALLVVVGIVATVLCGISHWNSLRKLRRGEDLTISQWPLSITVAFLLSALGASGLWHILTH
jgi:uncharacterized membrane protein YidH (DUF202 family)